MKFTSIIVGFTLATSWWFTPEQAGQRMMKKGDFQQAAEQFIDPMRKGEALFRAGEFEAAEQSFARVPSAAGEYNRGNCLVMLGKYESAAERYQRALELKPDWHDAQVNLEVAEARARLNKKEGGEMTDGKLEADEYVFDNNKGKGSDDEQQEAGKEMTDAEVQALWMRKVQTKPAQFLKSKFAYQHAMGTSKPASGKEQVK
ncbi:tetratricopeptide repeat protein [Persicirhabdus sediminis]|uniref:Tetratricopeptide repeat protein n=1 Tax=Persicirhabdus sediminis TaxID=454144 RepID=A0A8J7SMT8_9BACT|nr:tetratricopeptide repeat protein [Persicirhabdus sediminis]MBK1792280.1 tetratricopeptide repeat protein [Persicirhabdus sediminis]